MDFDLLADDKTLVNWKGRVEQSVIEGKQYIIQFEPKTLLGSYLFDTPCIMKFKFIEDYQKMKKLDERLGKLNRKMNNEKQPFYENYQTVKDFVSELYNEMLDLERRFYTIKFFATNTFLAQAEVKFRIFNRFLKYLREEYVDVYEMLKYDIIPTLLKINDSLLQRGLLSLD